MRSISFDSVSLTTSPFSVTNISVEDVSNKEAFTYELARRRGGTLLSSDYRSKKFTMTGFIRGTSSDDLDANIDTLKETVNREAKNLDIEYASGTRRYVATAINVNIKREHYSITYVPFEVEFIVPDGIGKATAETTDTVSGITDLTYDGSISVVGTAEPPMKLTITVAAAVSVTEIYFQANGSRITLTTAIAASDVIVFDGETLKVTKNGTEVDYTGIFPEFSSGTNLISIVTTGTSIEYTRTLAYTKRYL